MLVSDFAERPCGLVKLDESVARESGGFRSTLADICRGVMRYQLLLLPAGRTRATVRGQAMLVRASEAE